MQIEFKKDLRHNYMVISASEMQPAEAYCVNMLEHQNIEGMLTMERRQMDNTTRYYYDITTKQSLTTILDKSLLNYHRLVQLCTRVISIIEGAYDYLLPESDFILSPEHLYLDLVTDQPYLCYIPGYSKDIMEQMSSLLEYLMNKVDYNDKDAVLLVYQLFAVSKEEGFTFEHLLGALKNSSCNKAIRSPGIQSKNSKETQSENSFSGLKQKAADKNDLKKIPIMMERIENEQEIPYYPFKIYLYTGITITVGILAVLLCFTTKLLYNSFGNRLDISKVFALLLIIFCVVGYLLKLIWDKNNRITKIISTAEYIDPRKAYDETDTTSQKKYTELSKSGEPGTEKRPYYSSEYSVSTEKKNSVVPEEDTEVTQVDQPTCLLNAFDDIADEKKEFVLIPVNELNYKTIVIKDIPFFIGKLKKNVDYCLENDAVSRYHAKVTKEDEQYYITDLNSTNGTFVNNEILETYQKKELNIGDEVIFANIKYIFSSELNA